MPIVTHAVITGLGVVSPFGCGRERFVAGLAAGQPILSEVDTSAGYHLNRGARLVAAPDDRELGEWVPARLARRMSLPSRHAVGAARMALVDAGLDPKEKLGPRAIVSMATAYGMPGVTEELLHDILDDPTTASPFAFPESVANAPAAQIAIMSGAGGLNLTFTERAAGPLLALGRAAREIRRGRADIALAGAFDETHPLLHACLDRLGALARERRGHPERPRPFAEDRDGFVLGGGATVLVVETEERARQRDANVLARVVASGGGFDPSAPAWDWGTGADVLGNRLRAFLDRHDVEVDRIVASASGSRSGDALEAGMLQHVFATVPTVLTPHAVTGAHAGNQLAAAVLTAAGHIDGPRPSDPNIILTSASPTERNPSTVLATALAAGGAASWLALAQP